MSHRNQIMDCDAAREFVLAGNAVFTLVSKVSGRRFTFRARRPEPTGPWFVGLLSGPENTSNYQFLGSLFPSKTGGRPTYRHGSRSRITMDAPSAKAFRWFWNVVCEHPEVFHRLEMWHEGHCGRCGRALTVPSSIAMGLGPECASRRGHALNLELPLRNVS